MLDVMVKNVQNCAVTVLETKSAIMFLECVLKDANQGTEEILAKKVNPYFQKSYQFDTFCKIYTVGY